MLDKLGAKGLVARLHRCTEPATVRFELEQHDELALVALVRFERQLTAQ